MTTRRLLAAADDAAKLGQRIGKSERKDGARARVTGMRVLTRGGQHEPVPASCEEHDRLLSPVSTRPQYAVCPSGCRPSCGAWRVWRARHPHLGHPLPLRLSPPLPPSSLCGPSLTTQPGFQSSLEGDFYYNVSGFRMGAHARVASHRTARSLPRAAAALALEAPGRSAHADGLGTPGFAVRQVSRTKPQTSEGAARLKRSEQAPEQPPN
jgi:hypothetical protein